MRDVTRRLLTPPLRAYIRYCPRAVGKAFLWTRVVDPYLAWHPHRYVARTTFGSELAGDSQEILQQYIYYFGEWEPHLTRWLSHRLRPGDAFIDAGANIGYFSLLASRLVGKEGSVVAIEASPSIYGALDNNLARNKATNVRGVNLAVSDSYGIVKIYRGPDTNLGLTSVLPQAGHELEGEVPAAPLSAILTEDEINRARVVKIDVEGWEWSAVVGLVPLLYRGREDLEVVVEVSPQRLEQEGRTPEDLFAIFYEAGFTAYCLHNDYSPLSYLAPYAEERPRRIGGPVDYHVDAVFSRERSAVL